MTNMDAFSIGCIRQDRQRTIVEDMICLQDNPLRRDIRIVFRPFGRLDVEEQLHVVPLFEEWGERTHALAPLDISISVPMGVLINTFSRGSYLVRRVCRTDQVTDTSCGHSPLTPKSGPFALLRAPTPTPPRCDLTAGPTLVKSPSVGK